MNLFELEEELGQLIERDLIGSVGKSLARVFVSFDKNSVTTSGDGRSC
jgi:hypothetical protein